MEAIILAGGFGTRLKTVVPDLPKPMASVAGRPFLEILLTSLSNKGFSRIVLSVGYMSEKIINHFGDNFLGMTLSYVIEESPLGTGGAISKAFNICTSDHVYVLNGDTFLDIEVDEIENQWQDNQVPIIVACEVPDTARYGRLEISEGCVTGFSEKGMEGVGLINAGCYILPINLFDGFISPEKFSFETDFLIRAVIKQRFDFYITRGIFIDIGVPDDYKRAQTLLSFDG